MSSAATITQPNHDIPCPYCGSSKRSRYEMERGFKVDRCDDCAFLYVNPRPNAGAIDQAVRTGVHGENASRLNVVAHRHEKKVDEYSSILGKLFEDVWARGVPISWVDVGAGYGEIMEAVTKLAPKGSTILGVEPMRPKAQQAIARGLSVTVDYLQPSHHKVQFASVVDVFSHIPDFGAFLQGVHDVLMPNGELFIETGNLADLKDRDAFPGELGLPDHLTFAGEKHIVGFLERGGFDIIRLERMRIDGAVHFVKNVVKKTIGRPVKLGIPYTSDYRRLLVRARRRT